jgi:cytochrome c oxidase assembly protein subunit 15
MNTSLQASPDGDPGAVRPYHAICRATAISTAVLIGAGALVTTTGSGLSVPDWPTTFGTFFPPFSRWVHGVQFEHTHRLIAGAVATLMLVSGVWVVRREPRRGVRILAIVAMAAVLVQALLGGLTVLLKLPPAVSASHGTLAQTFFCMIVALSMATSASWASAERRPADNGARGLQLLAVMLTLCIWVQLVIGAAMRHLHAGLAIPDFPTSFGQVVPPFFSASIAVNFAHRIGALVIFTLAMTVVGYVLARFRADRALFVSALRLGGFVLLQVGLGAATVWSQRNVIVTSLHVLNGALVLVSSVILAMWAFRLYGPASMVEVAETAPARVPMLQGASR